MGYINLNQDSSQRRQTDYANALDHLALLLGQFPKWVSRI